MKPTAGHETEKQRPEEKVLFLNSLFQFLIQVMFGYNYKLLFFFCPLQKEKLPKEKKGKEVPIVPPRPSEEVSILCCYFVFHVLNLQLWSYLGLSKLLWLNFRK